MLEKHKKKKVESAKKAPKLKSKGVASKSTAKKPAPAKKSVAVKVHSVKAKSTKGPIVPLKKVAPKVNIPVKKGKSSKAIIEPARKPMPVVKTTLLKTFINKQKQRLIELRDHILDQMHGVAQDTLRVKAEGSEASAFGMHQADAGSDAYDKDFALSLLSQEQDALYEIEEALKRVESDTYGVCEMSLKQIPKPRLEAIPHARFTVECQAQLERENRGRRRWDTTPQFMDSADALVDEDDDGAEEDERHKEKD